MAIVSVRRNTFRDVCSVSIKEIGVQNDNSVFMCSATRKHHQGVQREDIEHDEIITKCLGVCREPKEVQESEN